MVVATNLTKVFDDVIALDDMNMFAPAGVVYGLVGSNGAGKTTLICHLSGMYRQDAGEVFIDGQPVFENTTLKTRIGCIPDNLYYYPQNSTRDMAKFYSGIYPGFSWERYRELAPSFPIDEKRAIRRLSKGMQKQSAFWLAIACNFDVLLLDEPVDGLDPVMRRTVWNLLLEDVKQRGLTVVVSSHNLRELEDVCNHVGIMHNGKIVIERNLTQLQEGAYKLQTAFENDLPEVIPGMEELSRTISGNVYNIIARGNMNSAAELLAPYSPMFVDMVPLTLEEIFIYEMGGENYGEIF